MAIGANVLLGYVRNIMKNENAPAASGERVSRPTAAASQEIARMKASSRPAAARAAGRVGEGRKPIRSATPRTRTVETMLRTALEATWPARIDLPPTSSERRRSMMPPFMSSLTPTAVPDEPKPAQSSRTPGTT